MLTLTTGSWHVRFFYLAERIWKLFAGTWNESNSMSTDLCTYLRTIFVLMPLALALNLTFWCGVFYVVFFFPVHTFGAFNLLRFLGIVAGGTVFAIAVVFAVAYLAKGAPRVVALMSDMWPEKPEPKAKPKRSGPSLSDLLWQYIVDAHNKVCVVVKIQEQTK